MVAHASTLLSGGCPGIGRTNDSAPAPLGCATEAVEDGGERRRRESALVGYEVAQEEAIDSVAVAGEPVSDLAKQ